ncbi:hypothetical protein OG988_26980 [Streptomyces zaomyceticus]|uniref:hypothetical protein n=1 Tax=Streptomyces zaomyceticus TaxID=68286 RepID=UPI003255A3E0
MSDKSVPAPRRNKRPDVEFTPVNNGLDYLDSAVRCLEGPEPPNAYDLKYAVLHLQAATEVLLKVRLAKEHWSLVFADPGKASLQAYNKGEFNSCTVEEALKRLEEVASVKLLEDGKAAIGKLQKIRNALTHFGHVENAYAVEAQAAAVLDFLLEFIHLHLKSEPGVYETMDRLRLRLAGIQRYVRDRMNKLSGVLTPLVGRTVWCNECGQWAVVVGESNVTCRFCLYEYGEEPEAAALEYKWMRHYPDDFIVTCKGCGSLSILKCRVASDKDRECLLCFACGDRYVRTGETVVIPS